MTHGSSRRLKPRRGELVLSRIVGVPDRTVLPTGFVGARRPARIHIVATEEALYVLAERRTTRMPWTEFLRFEPVSDVFGNFVIGELRDGDSFRICLSGDETAVGSIDRLRVSPCPDVLPATRGPAERALRQLARAQRCPR